MKEKIALASILANAVLAGSKIAIGLFSRSSAILAEGFHSLTDIFSSSIGYWGIKTSQKPVDKEHPYGHYKFEVLSGAVITVILFITGAGVIYESVRNLLSGEELRTGFWAFFIMFLSVIINFATSRIKIYYGKKENSLTLLADGSHDKADVLASLAVLAGLFLSKYWGYADSVLAFFIGAYIIKESFALGKEAVDSLLDVSAGDEIEGLIRKIAQEKNVKLSSLKTQKKGSAITANLEIKLPGNLEVGRAAEISENLRKTITREIPNMSYMAIQIKDYGVETDFYKPGLGKSFGWQRRGKFREKVEKADGRGPDGRCVCPRCGYSVPHERGVPCSTLKCPKCNLSLERK